VGSLIELKFNSSTNCIFSPADGLEIRTNSKQRITKFKTGIWFCYLPVFHLFQSLKLWKSSPEVVLIVFQNI